METRFLESLLVVVNTGSIAAAARQTQMTPAAVAQRIKALEAELGLSLFMRSGRNVHPTPACLEIVDRLNPLLREIRNLNAISTSDRIAGDLHIGCTSTTMTGLLPDLLSATMSRHPGLDVHVSSGNSVSLYNEVTSGELDAAIIVRPPFALPKSVSWKQLRLEPLVLLAPEGVKGKPEAILTEWPFIRYHRGLWGGKLAEDYLQSIGVKPREKFELSSLEAIAVMVDRGIGVSIVPDWPRPWPEGLSLSQQVVHRSQFLREVGIIWETMSPRAKLIAALIETAEVAFLGS